jgi:quercetin dioxygenase-like cupin family protein
MIWRRLSRATVHTVLVTTGLAVMMVAAYAQQQGGRGGAPTSFTGKVAIGDSADMRTSRIRFEAGARTYWHIHTAPQLLLVEEGKGRLQEQGSDPRDIPAGQPVLTKPNVLHWHGAAQDQAATQFSVYSGMLEWKDAVTDDEYTGKTRR